MGSKYLSWNVLCLPRILINLPSSGLYLSLAMVIINLYSCSIDLMCDRILGAASWVLWSSKNCNATKLSNCCLLYTSDAADDLLCVDLGGRRIIKKKKK